MNQATSELPRLASRQYSATDFSSNGKCMLVLHMVKCLRCLSLQGVSSLSFPSWSRWLCCLYGWQHGENPAAYLASSLHGPVFLYQDLFLGVQSDWFLPSLLLQVDAPPSQLYVALMNLRRTPYPLPTLVPLYLWRSLVPFASGCQGRECLGL